MQNIIRTKSFRKLQIELHENIRTSYCTQEPAVLLFLSEICAHKSETYSTYTSGASAPVVTIVTRFSCKNSDYFWHSSMQVGKFMKHLNKWKHFHKYTV